MHYTTVPQFGPIARLLWRRYFSNKLVVCNAHAIYLSTQLRALQRGFLFSSRIFIFSHLPTPRLPVTSVFSL